MTTTDVGLTSPHALPAQEVAVQLRVDPIAGLTSDEAAERSATSGPNELQVVDREPVWRMVVEAVTEPFVMMLAVAGILAIALGEVRDGAARPIRAAANRGRRRRH